MFLLTWDIFPWDLAIVIMIATGACVAAASLVWLRRNPNAARSQKILPGLFGFLGLLGALTVIYGSFVEPQMLVTTEHAIDFPVQKPLSIAVISDLHVGPYKNERFVEKVAQRILESRPDMILIAGDFLFDEASDPRELAPLRNLHAPLGVFAVLGNHDEGNLLRINGERWTQNDRTGDVAAALANLGITVLRNAVRIVETGSEQVAIVGTDDVWSRSFNLPQTMTAVPENIPAILLSHNPDIILSPESRRAQLIVAGHTHGGQVRLPFIGPLSPFPNALGHAFDQGIFALDDKTTLAVTRGAGETLARARLFAWPEIMLLRLRPHP